MMGVASILPFCTGKGLELPVRPCSGGAQHSRGEEVVPERGDCVC